MGRTIACVCACRNKEGCRPAYPFSAVGCWSTGKFSVDCPLSRSCCAFNSSALRVNTSRLGASRPCHMTISAFPRSPKSSSGHWTRRRGYSSFANKRKAEVGGRPGLRMEGADAASFCRGFAPASAGRGERHSAQLAFSCFHFWMHCKWNVCWQRSFNTSCRCATSG
jgi:hypothetical protein